MRELSCFGDGSVSVAVAAAASVFGRGALDRSLQAATTSVYRAMQSSGKEMLVRVTWTRNAAGAAGVAEAFDDGDTASAAAKPSAARSGQVLLHERRGSRSLLTGAGTAVGVHWDTAEANYPSAASPEPERDYGLAVLADAELALLLGAGAAVCDLSRRLGQGTAAPVPRGGSGAELVSRREQLRARGGGGRHAVQGPRGREEHEVAVHACRGGDGELRVSIDGEKMAEVRRGFRGCRPEGGRRRGRPARRGEGEGDMRRRRWQWWRKAGA
ncbi:hypothetical protein BAE44_0005391 [Dichanthelium oligosanthes]|uniref:Uncharacterized protein n=1 Tax=Dichanthelium oligosanthes TaxID=888268 RepID=A0A1E5W8L0_9POAL|nr:hypothetical protein BAE44_0005391 [Dichanthelium oligosanthes]